MRALRQQAKKALMKVKWRDSDVFSLPFPEAKLIDTDTLRSDVYPWPPDNATGTAFSPPKMFYGDASVTYTDVPGINIFSPFSKLCIPSYDEDDVKFNENCSRTSDKVFLLGWKITFYYDKWQNSMQTQGHTNDRAEIVQSTGAAGGHLTLYCAPKWIPRIPLKFYLWRCVRNISDFPTFQDLYAQHDIDYHVGSVDQYQLLHRWREPFTWHQKKSKVGAIDTTAYCPKFAKYGFESRNGKPWSLIKVWKQLLPGQTTFYDKQVPYLLGVSGYTDETGWVATHTKTEKGTRWCEVAETRNESTGHHQLHPKRTMQWNKWIPMNQIITFTHTAEGDYMAGDLALGYTTRHPWFMTPAVSNGYYFNTWMGLTLKFTPYWIDI